MGLLTVSEIAGLGRRPRRRVLRPGRAAPSLQGREEELRRSNDELRREVREYRERFAEAIRRLRDCEGRCRIPAPRAQALGRLAFRPPPLEIPRGYAASMPGML